MDVLDTVNKISVTIQRKKIPRLHTKDVEREQVRNVMRKFVLFFKTKTRKQNQNHVLIKSLSILIDVRSHLLRMWRAQQTCFLWEHIVEGNQYQMK